MNPIPLTTGEWADTGNALKLLWISVALAITGGGSLVLAHAMIPSAADSGLIPPAFRKLRPLLYATAALMIVGIVIAVVFIIGFVDFWDDLYPRRFR